MDDIQEETDLITTPLHVVDHVKMNVKVETPIPTPKSVIKTSKSDFSFTTQQLRTIEDKTTHTFVEFITKLQTNKRSPYFIHVFDLSSPFRFSCILVDSLPLLLILSDTL